MDVVQLVENDDGVFVTPQELVRERLEKMAAVLSSASVSMEEFGRGLSTARDSVAGLGVSLSARLPGV